MAEHDGTETLENARVGYQVAANLSISEGQTLWSKFNTLLLANSIILASIGLSMTASTTTRGLVIFSKVMPVIGIALCWLWFSIAKRGFDFYKYWIFSARELEEQYLSHPIQTLSLVVASSRTGERSISGSEARRNRFG